MFYWKPDTSQIEKVLFMRRLGGHVHCNIYFYFLFTLQLHVRRVVKFIKTTARNLIKMNK